MNAYYVPGSMIFQDKYCHSHFTIRKKPITYQFISQGGKGNILLHIRRQIQGIYIKKAYKSIHLN